MTKLLDDWLEALQTIDFIVYLMFDIMDHMEDVSGVINTNSDK